MKSDLYLNLCVEQARLSPLHYRHGSIVVKGGKVIGQGFNDYRPGYDGGSVLKSGVLPKSGFSSLPSSVDCSTPGNNSGPPKFKLKANKHEFKPVEAVSGHCGGGHHANVSLSMHSEMMAINSALASSSTLAAMRPSPPTSAPSASPLRAALMRSSSNNVPARLRATSGVLNPVHLDATTSNQKVKVKAQQRHQNQKENQKENQNQNQNQNQNRKRTHQRRSAEEVSKQYRHKDGYKYIRYKSYKKSQPHAMTTDTTSHDEDLGDGSPTLNKVNAPSDADSDIGALGHRKARNKHVLVPKKQTGSSVPGVKERMKHPKLVGADVYVTRLARPCLEPPVSKDPPEGSQHKDNNNKATGKNELDACSKSSGLSSSTGSLHDELSCQAKEPDSSIAEPADVGNTRVIAESRPCYRCISYMHSVGIKRVFWTTSEGKWEGAKIRELVDQLEGATANPDDPLSLPVFVTKHEVLLLRRLMKGGDS